MNELRCPKCGNVFQVDEADYASIVSQVKNAEFKEELESRISEILKQHNVEKDNAILEVERRNDKEKAEKDVLISSLKQDLQNAIDMAEKNIELAVAKKEQELKNSFAEKERQYVSELSEEKAKTVQLESELKESDGVKRLAVMEAENKAKDEIREKELQIRELESQAKIAAQNEQIRINDLNEQHKKEIAFKDETIAQYKDFKARMSTKGIGESLEIYCNNQFERNVRPYMPCAVFGKDNDVVDHTKGDFVFRDFVDGVESVSIMFEMKNEADETVSKHKNENFFQKLDSDRTKKNCEYAVLVSLLELDNDLYNDGIYSVPGYEKMYVVRPQQFLTIISLLVQNGRNTVKVRKELEEARSKEVDVTNFEEKIEAFKDSFTGHYNKASKKFKDAIQHIDDTIKKLQKVKEDLESSDDYLRLANQDTDALTIRKLTYKNPTMKAKFDEARKGGEEK